jgi:chromosome segregation protein
MSYIKKLVMHGFKSFPRKTEIPFTEGINVILGPNGSGKSNISDALCFVLGRLSIKSLRAAKAGNLIFMGTKAASPAKEASVEIVFDNSRQIFSMKGKEVSIKRMVRRNGQSVYKINNETKTRQEVIGLLAQAGIDPQGFNIILQGEIQNFVRMQPDDRRKIIEEVSGISIYESRKEKSLRELDKTEDRLKEIASILRERTAYLNNLEKERQQALRFKKLERGVKRLKASIISSDLSRKKKEEEAINSEISKKNREIEKIKKSIVGIEAEIKNFESKIDSINSKIQESAGIEQEKLNSEIANLRADLAGMNVKLENQKTKFSEISKKKQELNQIIKDNEISIRELKGESPASKKEKEIEIKRRELERLEESRKKFYMIKSELKSIRERISDKNTLFQNYTNESDFLLKQIEALSIKLFDKRSGAEKLDALKVSLVEKRDTLGSLLKREAELEKKTYINESEIENQKKIMEKISRMDLCPICKSRITPEHMNIIKKEAAPKISSLKREIENADKELKSIYQKKEIINNDIGQIVQEISKTESDLNKISNINEKKSQITSLQEKIDKTKEELSELVKRRKTLEENFERNSNIEQKYETLGVEIQEISMRSKETIDSEISFKQRELERSRISLKQLSREEGDIKEEITELEKNLKKKEKLLERKKKQEEELNKKFQKLISERDGLQRKIREKESQTLGVKNTFHRKEQEVNDFKIEKARVGAEVENLETELSEFSGIEVIKVNRDGLVQRLAKTQDILSKIGSVNLRSLEVYDSIKKEYDSIKEKAEVISKEKEGILKIIHEIDVKKKKAFLQTLKKLNEIFSRNFSQLSTKGQVWLDLENRKDPFDGGVNILVKTGHGKYFDVKSLSGGEQTLVALSLIFAIQEYSPYYFYLLDEVDAALDKRNSERLSGLLQKHMKKGQYILITHNDEVITRATNLYGVSMHEGISKIISLKI